MPGPIMIHTAHHVDPKIPVRQLEIAQSRLMAAFSDRIPICFSTFSDCMDIMRRCKLYDYETHRWLDFDGQPTTQAIQLSGAAEESGWVRP